MEGLRAELFKSRAETHIALAEKEKAEGERLHAALKLDQTKARLDDAQKALDARVKVRRGQDHDGEAEGTENATPSNRPDAVTVACGQSRQVGARAEREGCQQGQVKEELWQNPTRGGPVARTCPARFCRAVLPRECSFSGMKVRFPGKRLGKLEKSDPSPISWEAPE
jgi:hypothetical protein